MSAKRALVVDDSKSARAFLARILERYEISVDAAESAEQAIDYLTRHNPDVIFMDHLMPGMDGFQAVQSIKNNPRTATIPIMMYTSQEGELYLGQARALGAVGVLPKQIQPADVSKVLYQLHLVPDRRSREQDAFVPANEAAISGGAGTDSTVLQPLPGFALANAQAAMSAPTHAAGTPEAPTAEPLMAHPALLVPEIRALIDSTLRAEAAELRRHLTASLDAQSDRIFSEVRSLLPEDRAPEPPPMILPPQSQPWGWVAAALSLLAALGMGTLWWRQNQELLGLRTELGELRGVLSAVRSQPAPTPAAAEDAATADSATEAAVPAENDAQSTATPRVARAAMGAAIGTATLPASSASANNARNLVTAITEYVPYGEVPLAGTRVENMRTLLSRLAAQQFRGVIEVTPHPGRFCLIGSAIEGYSLAPDDTPLAKCAVLGNPFDEALSPAERQSLQFATLTAEFRKSSQGAIDVRVLPADLSKLAKSYPDEIDRLTAADWNKVALSNNRVDIRLKPASKQ